MSGSLPWGSTTQVAPASSPNEALDRIERNTAEMVRWVKILVVVMVITVLLDALLFI